MDLKVSPYGGTTRYSGVWRAGSEVHFLWVGVDWNNLRARRLAKYAGVWRAGSGAHYLWSGVARSGTGRAQTRLSS